MSTSTSSETAAQRHCRHMAREVRSLRREVDRLRAVADEVVAAETWDPDVYGLAPGPGWLLVDRDSWTRVLAALREVDGWRPWAG